MVLSSDIGLGGGSVRGVQRSIRKRGLGADAEVVGSREERVVARPRHR